MSVQKKITLFIAIVLIGVLLYFNPELNEVGAGVAILLFGILFIEEGFKLFTNNAVERFLERSTKSLFGSINFGFLTTSLLQSSSLVTVITISFVSTGLIVLSSGIGIIYGANIGTTTGAWLIAVFGLKVEIAKYAFPILIFGAMFLFQKDEDIKAIGYIITGIGFLFLGIHFMKVGFSAYESSIALDQLSSDGIIGTILYVGIGIFMTVIMQSSHASIAIILTALSTSQIDYSSAIALTIGANVGTTITAIIGSLGSTSAGKRLASGHVIFNITLAVLSIIFFHQFIRLTEQLSVLLNISQFDYTLHLALFNSLYKTFGVIIFIPITKYFVILLEKIIKEDEEKDISVAKYITKSALKYPETAIPALIKETQHLFDNAFEILSHGLNLHREDILSNKKLKAIIPESTDIIKINIDEVYLKKVKVIYSQIIKYATLIQSSKLNSEEVKLVNEIRSVNRYLVEAIKGVQELQENMAKYINSDNENMRAEYNTLRLKIAKVMREIYRTRDAKEIDEQRKKLSNLKRKAKMHDVLINGKLDYLIRERLITKGMATSLMNDSALVAKIVEWLINVAELLYFHSDSIMVENNQKYESDEDDFFEDKYT
ncbi:Sodium-dependent phosphate transporter [hydrothermal vent metagenome]|uniref:Sodium-dependent phosphate transporter n=1 Tax=hydrothermal vent metagenome TaxID=652676 RepID=A0A3B1CBG9_9ZZZZ